MARSLAAASLLVLFVSSLLLAAPPDGTVRVELRERHVSPGSHQVILSVYGTAEGGSALASETRTVQFDQSGAFNTTLGSLASATVGSEGRWLGVRVPPGEESRRVAIAARTPGGVAVHVVTDAAITANGFVESIAQGFRFPDGSIQTSAAQVSGGVPSVNGIGSAVTIAGAGTASVGTVGSTITVTGTGLSGVTAGNGLTGGGSSGSPTVSATYGTPVTVGTANANGAANTLARSDHVHAHGDQTVGTLHAAALTSTAGFMSGADKTKLMGTYVYVRTIIVGPAALNSTAAANGAALLAALSAISLNTATTPFLLKIEPGVYDIGATQLFMKCYVDMEGSGQNATFITATRGNTSLNSSAAAVIGANNAELRNLTVSNTSGSTYGICFYMGGGTARIRDVTINSAGASAVSYGSFTTSSGILTLFHTTVTASGGNSGATGLTVEVGANLTVSSSTITATSTSGTSSTAVYLAGSTCVVKIESSTIVATGAANANYGVWVALGTGTITGSTVRVDTASIRVAVQTNADASAIHNVSHSLLLASGGVDSSLLSASKGTNSTLRIATSQVDSSFGVPKCVHVYDSLMNDLNNVCPAPIG